MTSFLAHLSHDCHASRWGMQQGSHGYMLLPSKVEHPNQGRKKKPCTRDLTMSGLSLSWVESQLNA